MRKSIHEKRAKRVRCKLKKYNSNRFRLSIFRSSRNISAQIIDDNNNATLVSASSLKKDINSKNNKSDLSVSTAELLAKKALEKKINKVYFDRGSYKYHGRIKIFAEILRKNGIDF